MRKKDVVFASKGLKLEGTCHYPDGDGPFPAVVLCHPHPLYGGSMDNDVVLTVAGSLVDKGIIAFMFNFRGVGLSQGEFDNGRGEQEDTGAAIGWLEAQKEVDKSRIGLAGYSFGGMVALETGRGNNRVKGVALISPALQPEQYVSLKILDRPLLLITGDEDHVMSIQQLEKMLDSDPDQWRVVIVPGADHFWHGHLKAMAGNVASFFSDLFESSRK